MLQPVSTGKLGTIRKLDLSSDILTRIERYCFYNQYEANTINYAKLKKRESLKLISLALSRNTVDFGNHWAFGYPAPIPENDPDDEPIPRSMDEVLIDAEHLQLQASNCEICGNYQNISNNLNMVYSPRIFCFCEEEEEEEDNEPAWG